MQKQLTIRDWILYSLLGLLILLLLLAMYQIDRQWLKLTEMQTALSEQSKDMRELRSAIAYRRSIGQIGFNIQPPQAGKLLKPSSEPMQPPFFPIMRQAIGVWMPSAPI